MVLALLEALASVRYTWFEANHFDYISQSISLRHVILNDFFLGGAGDGHQIALGPEKVEDACGLWKQILFIYFANFLLIKNADNILVLWMAGID